MELVILVSTLLIQVISAEDLLVGGMVHINEQIPGECKMIRYRQNFKPFKIHIQSLEETEGFILTDKEYTECPHKCEEDSIYCTRKKYLRWQVLKCI